MAAYRKGTSTRNNNIYKINEKSYKCSHPSFREASLTTHVRGYVSTAAKLFKKKEFMKRLGLMAVIWFTVGCSSYGIHFAAKFVAYDIFVTTIVKEVVIIATILIFIPIYERVKKIT